MTPSRLPRRTSLGAAVTLGGALAFLVLDATAESHFPGFDRATDPMSLLGASGSPVKTLWLAALLILAGAWLVGALTVLSVRDSWPLVVLNLVPVFGIAGAAAIPLDSNIALHEIAAFIAFLGGSMAVIADSEHLRAPWRQLSIALACVALVGLSAGSGTLIPLVGWGTVERMVVFPLVGAVAVFGLAVLTGGRQPTTGPALRPRPATVALLVAAAVVGLSGIGSGLTAGGYAQVVAWLGGFIPRAG